MTVADALELLGRLKAAWPRHPISSATAEEYCRHLLAVELPAGATAIDEWIATSQWFPTIAELLRIVRGAEPALMNGLLAWQQLMRQLHSSRALRQGPELDELSMEALEAIGGWDALKTSPLTNLLFARSAFIAQFDALAGARQRLAELTAVRRRPSLEARHGKAVHLGELAGEIRRRLSAGEGDDA